MTTTAFTERLVPLVAGGALVAALLCPTALSAASGRDLTFGYTWRDSADGATALTVVPPVPVFVTPTNNGAPNGPYTMGFTGGFPFYGASYTQFWISDNGWVSFTNPGGNSFPAPSGIPNAAGPVAMLAPQWNDYVPSSVAMGFEPARGLYLIRYIGTDNGTGAVVWFEIVLSADGRIRFQYPTGATLGNATVGIEKAPVVDDGIQIAAGGVVLPGVSVGPGYVIEYSLPAVLPPQCATLPVAACGRTMGTSPPAGPNILYYGCDFNRWGAQDQVYSFTLTQPTLLSLNLTSANGLSMFLLDACDEGRCLVGPTTNIPGLPMAAGTYYVAVDGPTVAAEGAFTLDIGCPALGAPLACGSPASGTTVGGASLWDLYPSCAGLTSLTGPEAIYRVDIAAPTNLRVNLDFAAANLDIVVLRPGVGQITAADCVAWGDGGAVAWNAQPGLYLVAVDGQSGASGTFDISTSCRIDVDCAPPEDVITLGTTGPARVVTVTGDTTTGAANTDQYACDLTGQFFGSELVYEVVLPAPGQIGVFETTGMTNLSWFILSACNEGTCLGNSGEPACAPNLDAGTYYLVVDSAAGDEGPFEMMVAYENTFNRWDVCEGASGATLPTDTSSPFWNFDDGAFCHTDPASRNYPNGCTFAMYATVRCGTAMHLPFFDTEGGHVRIFDILRGEYVFLTARSGGGFFQQGTDIDWSLMDCTGSDGRWNEVVTDVYFERPDGLCGIFRLEFPNHSGFVWELYANCAGDRSPQFNIHDSLCTAMADYQPLPAVVIVSAFVTATCPDAIVDYAVRNDGCVAVTDFPVGLFDDATMVGSSVVPRIEAGQTVVGSFMVTFPVLPTGTVTLQADPANVVVECTEVPGASCEATNGLESIEVPGCTAECRIVPQVSATPSRLCGGEPTTISGAASGSALCPGGVLEFQLTGPMGTLPWQSSPDFTGLLPLTTTSYTLEVRCADLALRDTCIASRSVQVEVDRRPDLDPASVTGVDIAVCNPGINLNWSAATFHGVLGTGSYTIYRSEISCADAVMRPPIAIGLMTTSYPDVLTAPDTTYYYVLEAEDTTTGGTCSPPGRRNGGATRRVDFNGGTCVGITDAVTPQPDLLPRVGSTLRVGGSTPFGRRYAETFVEMEWVPDRPISVPLGEHFHVLRSDRPDGGFALYSSEPPQLQLTFFQDFGADDPFANGTSPHVWHYKVFTADACENDNQVYDP